MDPDRSGLVCIAMGEHVVIPDRAHKIAFALRLSVLIALLCASFWLAVHAAHQTHFKIVALGQPLGVIRRGV